MGEFDLIEKIKSIFPSANQDGQIGIGDDCAVLDCGNGREWLVSTDMLIEDVHFLRSQSPYSLGWKSAAVNISDIAAMGGTPRWVFLSMALPADISQAWIDEFLKGFRDILAQYHVLLMGGDTCSSQKALCINVAIVGETEKGKSLKRSAARVGDWVAVTGPLGDSAAGLKCILSDLPADENIKALIQKHTQPCSRIHEGLQLAQLEGIGAMMDISDGIASDLRHILKASDVGARVNVTKIPRSAAFSAVCQRESWDELDLALGGGEDYELLFTCRPGIPLPPYCTVIGEITSHSEQLEWIGSERDFSGYRHF